MMLRPLKADVMDAWWQAAVNFFLFFFPIQHNLSVHCLIVLIVYQSQARTNGRLVSEWWSELPVDASRSLVELKLNEITKRKIVPSSIFFHDERQKERWVSIAGGLLGDVWCSSPVYCGVFYKAKVRTKTCPVTCQNRHKAVSGIPLFFTPAG